MVDMAAGCLKPVFEKIAEFGLDLLSSPLQLDDRNRRLGIEVGKLRDLRRDKQHEVNSKKDGTPTRSYWQWTHSVDDLVQQSELLRSTYARRQLPKWRICERSSLSNEMAEKLDEIEKLKIPQVFLDVKKLKPVIEVYDFRPIEGYQTLQKCKEDILVSLKNTNIQKIGVSGTMGVGKTTLMWHLSKSEEVTKLFQVVIFVRVGSTGTTIPELQQTIINQLSLDNDNVNDPAVRIREELKPKKYLLILDDVVHSINLNWLGIPENNDGSKVLIATRYPHLYKYEVQKEIKVTLLSPDDAWKMFKEIAGPVIDRLGVEGEARRACNRCSRLPLLIDKIASSFKFKDSVPSWKHGVDNLMPWPQLEDQGEAELYSILTFCYTELGDQDKKNCFLYTSLYPADSKIYSDYLVECWAAHGFLRDVNDTGTYQAVRNYGSTILEKLIQATLLEKGESMKYVSMNDFMKQLAWHISSRLDTWQPTRRVSRINQNSLPTDQDCKTLLTLLLRKSPKLHTIPPKYFKNMGDLILLDLYDTGIKQLPYTLSKLTGLKGIYLNGCWLLKELPSEIKSLENLEVLDIRGSGVVTSIPRYLKHLTNLRCLRISYGTDHCRNEDAEASHQCGYENVRSKHYCGDPNVISKLHKLEELLIEVICWKQWSNDAEGVIQQVASLTNLSNLECSFPSSSILQKFLEKNTSSQNSRQFNLFRFFVGCESSKCHQIIDSFENRINTYLKYCNGGWNDDSAISQILPQTDVCELVCHRDIESLSTWVEAATLNQIRGIVIKCCKKLSTVLAGDVDDNNVNVNGGNPSILPKLDHLYLDDLPTFSGPLPPRTLSNLKTLTLKKCSKLVIISNVANQGFSNLQKLTIEDCSLIEKLFDVNERYVLQQLELLILKQLPELTDICKYQMLECCSLESIEIHGCPKLKGLPFGMHDAANLRFIKGERKWWNSLVWENRDREERFQSMFVASNN